jgi:polynucleotide 5'-kinase involved in rRNA processing
MEQMLGGGGVILKSLELGNLLMSCAEYHSNNIGLLIIRSVTF